MALWVAGVSAVPVVWVGSDGPGPPAGGHQAVSSGLFSPLVSSVVLLGQILSSSFFTLKDTCV